MTAAGMARKFDVKGYIDEVKLAHARLLPQFPIFKSLLPGQRGASGDIRISMLCGNSTASVSNDSRGGDGLCTGRELETTGSPSRTGDEICKRKLTGDTLDLKSPTTSGGIKNGNESSSSCSPTDTGNGSTALPSVSTPTATQKRIKRQKTKPEPSPPGVRSILNFFEKSK